MSEANRLTFWSWYRHSARTDGALVSARRRILGASIGIVLFIGGYLWTNRTQPKVTDVTLRLARTHPFCFLGIVLAFAFMALRGVALEYLAYSVYRAQVETSRLHSKLLSVRLVAENGPDDASVRIRFRSISDVQNVLGVVL